MSTWNSILNGGPRDGMLIELPAETHLLTYYELGAYHRTDRVDDDGWTVWDWRESHRESHATAGNAVSGGE